MKQETIEEAARIFAKLHPTRDIDEEERYFNSTNCKYYDAFKEGAKWQKERMYSEEDMRQFAWECVANFLSNDENKIEMALVEVIIDRNNKQFEKFKKK
jgi:hypothetical protein